jgi:hypothetical protein
MIIPFFRPGRTTAFELEKFIGLIKPLNQTPRVPQELFASIEGRKREKPLEKFIASHF